ncbi:helix-turn-helix transcriptional regulator [Nonomuraea angiospora]|uniref:helix-turn-helix transcriptional regulator n=1 Tax=Nonomuraea angiospora TaxID=46172 RepID=UPI0037A2D94D
MSVEYYAKLERGHLAGVSAGVLDALARALHLDDAERAHLLRLAHEANGSNAILRRRRPRQPTARPGLQRMLDTITTAPAIIGNNRSDLLAANHLGRALYCDVYADPNRPPNFARFTFLDSAARRLYPDWDLAADMTVANLRAEPDLSMTIYAAEPGSPSEDALRLLASWAARTSTPSGPRTPTTLTLAEGAR